ncbi:hypothetical protein [Paenibacillus sinopodophylli]|uniref:hypothetical protein n=1 Tax=Paenibacillus sinopodophylli TaxID=1837342 RepID=UPI00110C988B|nr:hypothetical protein [Paenibacillus sinopodophylli]
MRAPRDKVSIAEVLATDPDTLEEIIKFHDASVGEFFFLKDEPNQVHLIVEEVFDEVDREHRVRNERGEVIDYYELALPLFSGTAMMDIIRQHCQTEIRSAYGQWMIILQGADVIQSEEGEDLIALLWRVLKKVHLEYPI